MQEVFEKIIEELYAESFLTTNDDGETNEFSVSVVDLKDAVEVVKGVAAGYNNGWIPFKQRELTEEEKQSYSYAGMDYMLDGKLPGEEEEILVTYSNGTVGTDIFMRDWVECYLDSGCELVKDVVAWQPLPTAYQQNICGEDDSPHNDRKECPAWNGCGGYEPKGE